MVCVTGFDRVGRVLEVWGKVVLLLETLWHLSWLQGAGLNAARPKVGVLSPRKHIRKEVDVEAQGSRDNVIEEIN